MGQGNWAPLLFHDVGTRKFKMSRKPDHFLTFALKGGPQKGGLLDRKFKIVRIGRFWRFQRDWTRKICGIL